MGATSIPTLKARHPISSREPRRVNTSLNKSFNKPSENQKDAPEGPELISEPQLELHISRPELQAADLADIRCAGVEI